MKLIYTGIGSLSVGAVAGVIAIVMELITQEPVYLIMMKVAALFFGVGGGLLGLRALTKRKL